MAERSVLAIDIGGTKLAAGVVDATGRLIASARAPTPRDGSAEDLFAALETLARDVVDRAQTPIVGIGVGCGGPMQYPSGVVSPLNIPGWRGFPLRARLMAAFERPCVVDNDAKTLALGEQWQGAGRGSNNMLGMVVSTGVGGGVILDGRLLHGQSGNAGHIGHIVVWPGGPRCGCGGHGCLEGVASGSGLVRRLSEALAAGAQSSLRPPARHLPAAAAATQPNLPAAGQPNLPATGQPNLPASGLPGAPAADPSGVTANRQPGGSAADQPDLTAGGQPSAPDASQPNLAAAGQPGALAADQADITEGVSAVDIAVAARQGDALAIELFRTAGEGVGRGIASAAAVLDLELVVIGGSIALHAWDLLGPPLEAELRRAARLDFTRAVRVVHAELGDEAGLFGAALLALQAQTSPPPPAAP